MSEDITLHDAVPERSRPAFLARRRYELLWAAAFLGLAVHLGGLAVDLVLHSRDESLAAREGVLTLSNPGHALLFAGMGIITAALAGLLITWSRERLGPGRAGRALGLAGLPGVALSVAGAVWLVSLERDTVHEHGEASHALVAADHPHEAASPGAGGSAPQVSANAPGGAAGGADGHSHAAASSGAMSEENAHFHHPEVAATEDQLRAALAFVDEVRTKTKKYEDVRAALAEGYIQVTQDLPGIAAHFARLPYLNDGFELNANTPEVLLYTKRLDGQWRFVGVMFSSESIGDTPPSYFGSLDAWHYHENLCFGIGTVRVVKAKADCTNGLFNERTAWELHVWTVPGASGPFSHDLATISPGAYPAATELAAAEVARRPQ